MASLIDPTKPTQGNATTESVRANFAQAKTEIEALQNAQSSLFVLYSAVNVEVAWTNLPLAEQLLPTWYATIRPLDLTHKTQARFIAVKGPIAGAVGAHVHIGINPNPENIPANFLPILSELHDLPIDSVDQILDTGWQDIQPAAKVNGWTGIVGHGGNGTLDPRFLGFYAFFR